jgi:1,4-dihydroxy-2-naphthoyl-CoA hydrolase
MSIWRKAFDLSMLKSRKDLISKTLVGHLGIEYTAFGPNWLEATMPVDERTVQPYGILHGGASVVLAETLGSYASALASGGESDDKVCVGLDISATHLRSVKSGSSVTGRVMPIRLGNRIHVWEIKMHETGKEDAGLTCISRLTVMVSDKHAPHKLVNK